MSIPDNDSTPRKWELKLHGLAVDPTHGDPVILLRDLEGQHQIPIWIGQAEAVAIASEMQGIRHPRPMTHDLLRASFEALGCEVDRIEIHDLKDNTFYARIVVVRGGEETLIDSRPSDAIALALRAGAAILVYDHVLWQARMDPTDAADDDDEGDDGSHRRIPIRGAESPEMPFQRPAPASDDDWARYLDDLDPEAFGKYKQ